MVTINEKCYSCKGTGDFQILYGRSLADMDWLYHGDYKCKRCNGTGIVITEYPNECKYCMKPCYGFCCEECYKTFEDNK